MERQTQLKQNMFLCVRSSKTRRTSPPWGRRIKTCSVPSPGVGPAQGRHLIGEPLRIVPFEASGHPPGLLILVATLAPFALKGGRVGRSGNRLRSFRSSHGSRPFKESPVGDLVFIVPRESRRTCQPTSPDPDEMSGTRPFRPKAERSTLQDRAQGANPKRRRSRHARKSTKGTKVSLPLGPHPCQEGQPTVFHSPEEPLSSLRA